MGRTRSRRLTRGLSTEQAAAGAPTPAGSPSLPPLHGERRVQIASGSTGVELPYFPLALSTRLARPILCDPQVGKEAN